MMTLIEGVGDEVVQFMVVVLILGVAALAWWSTNARPDRYRTVLVMRRPNHPITVSIRTRSNRTITASSQPHNNAVLSPVPEPTVASTSETADENTRDSSRVIPLQEMDSIVDADVAMINNNRLHFYRRLDSAPNSPLSALDSTSEESETQEESEPVSNAQIREMDSIVSAMEADVNTGCGFCGGPDEPESTMASANIAKKVKKDDKNIGVATASNIDIQEENGGRESASGEQATSSSVAADARRILIKLKYLNDTLKEVDGSLDELLKDFKLRHFSTELSSECRVRLIFNGRVLLDDAATLRACGLHDRAVVHCLVHPKRSAAQAQGGGEATPLNATHELITEGAPAERTWDLENILMTLVSVALTVVWFFRCEYSNMFTASASVALFGLTVFYSVAIFGLYLSDTFHFERRPAPAPAQPLPHN